MSAWRDGDAALGPIVVTPDEIPDPFRLRRLLPVKGQEKQRSGISRTLLKIEGPIVNIGLGIMPERRGNIANTTFDGAGAALPFRE